MFILLSILLFYIIIITIIIMNILNVIILHASYELNITNQYITVYATSTAQYNPGFSNSTQRVIELHKSQSSLCGDVAGLGKHLGDDDKLRHGCQICQICDTRVEN